MKSLNIRGQTQIENSATYCGIASDGECFYFSAPTRRELHKYSASFELLEIIPCPVAIGSLCFDARSSCFWALAQCEIGLIYKLDCRARIIGKIAVRDSASRPLPLSGVGDKDAQSLVISGNFGVAEVSKASSLCAIYSRDILQSVPTTAVALCQNCYISAINLPQAQALCCGLFSGEEQIKSVLPADFIPRDIAIVSADEGVFYVLATRSYRFNYVIACELSQPKISSASGEELYRQSLGGVINSIAQIEQSLAEILSAESRKIRRVLQCTDSCAEIIRINESVNKTISNVTQLEQVLCSKMNMAREFYNEL